MGTYIGHCHACDVTLEAEDLALELKAIISTRLLEKYGRETTLEIVEQLKFELSDGLKAEWFVEPFKTPEENAAELGLIISDRYEL